MADPEKSYKELNEGNVTLYKINKANGTHCSLDRVDGKLVFVEHVGGTATDTLHLTPADAEKYSHLELSEVEAAVEEEVTDEVKIPKNWSSFTPKKKAQIASKIAGQPVSEDDADAIIAAEIEVRKGA